MGWSEAQTGWPEGGKTWARLIQVSSQNVRGSFADRPPVPLHAGKSQAPGIQICLTRLLTGGVEGMLQPWSKSRSTSAAPDSRKTPRHRFIVVPPPKQLIY